MFNIRGKPEDACMKLAYHMLSLRSSLAEAVKDLLQPMLEHMRETLKILTMHN